MLHNRDSLGSDWLQQLFCAIGRAVRRNRLRCAVKRSRAAPLIVVPPGTVIVVTLDQTVSTKTSNVGDSFAATVAAPVIVDGSETIPKGAKAAGHITTADQAGRVKGGSRLVLNLDSITVHGATAQIHTAAVAEAVKAAPSALP